MNETNLPERIVAIVGGAVAGAEAAKMFAEKGFGVIVLEQNVRPYGKIEDGLPRWHDKLRIAEYKRIDEALSHPNVEFIPLTRLGRDVSFEEILREWRVSALILAVGAWRDRPLGLEGIDACAGKGFYYQNPFVYWFNHYPEKDFRGPHVDIADGGIVIGGGLASIDVVKALMVETISRALNKRGIAMDPCTLEHQGCDVALATHGLTVEALGVKPCTLYYRRARLDMPLVAFKEGASEEEKEKIRKARDTLLSRAMRKYLFCVEDFCRPVRALIEGGRVVGLRFAKTNTPSSEFEVRAGITVSSIGSLPQAIDGIPMHGELYCWQEGEVSRLHYDGDIFGLGNVVTGKGNIAASRRHSKIVTEHVSLLSLPAIPEGHRKEILARIRERQKTVGYDGSYLDWIRTHPPIDLAQQ